MHTSEIRTDLPRLTVSIWLGASLCVAVLLSFFFVDLWRCSYLQLGETPLHLAIKNMAVDIAIVVIAEMKRSLETKEFLSLVNAQNTVSEREIRYRTTIEAVPWKRHIILCFYDIDMAWKRIEKVVQSHSDPFLLQSHIVRSENGSVKTSWLAPIVKVTVMET